MRTEKGSAGYIRNQQRIRTIRTIVLFAIVFAVFALGLLLNGGDRRSIYSIIAAVGCIPAAMSAVSMIMIWMRRPVSPAFAEKVRRRAGDARLLLELYVTTAEHGLFLHAAVVRNDRVAAYAPEAKSAAARQAVTAHLHSALNQSAGPVSLTITQDPEEFGELLDELAAEQTTDPEVQEEIAQVLLALSL